MIEEIYEAVSKEMSEKVRIPKGAVVLIALCGFICGLIAGAGAASLGSRKKAKAVYSCGDDFDADEYVRNLSFDE